MQAVIVQDTVALVQLGGRGVEKNVLSSYQQMHWCTWVAEDLSFFQVKFFQNHS